MKDISSSIISEIKTKEIKPIPRWEFLLKEYVVWGIFVINLVLGSLGMGFIIYLFTHNEAVSEPTLVQNPLQWLFISVPIFWILLTLLFSFIAYYNFKHTAGGYRYTVAKILTVNLLISLILGILCNATGFVERINTALTEKIPYYQQFTDTRYQIWQRPEQGYLAGEIITIDEAGNQISLSDLNSKLWRVSITAATIKPSVSIKKGEKIKLLGKVIDENAFTASEIRPWEGRRKSMQENNPN
jgi:hypothetical protein